MLRRQILTSSGALLALALGLPRLVALPGARAAEDALLDGDRILGQADAGVTIIEYASLTCPHCATFHRGTLPQVKVNWIDPGKARLVYRHYPLDGLALRAAALSNCFEGERYFSFLDALFEGQQRWASAADPLAELGRLARLAGLDQARIDACIGDEAEMNRILEGMKVAQKTHDVQSTPTIVVNSRKLTGTMSYEDFDKVLQDAAAKS